MRADEARRLIAGADGRLGRTELIDLCETLGELALSAEAVAPSVARRLEALAEWVEGVLWGGDQEPASGVNSIASEFTQ